MKEKIINIIWHSGVVVIAIGLLTLIGVYAYKHRVVESKAYDVVATIDDKEHIPEYVTKTVYKDSDGNRRTIRLNFVITDTIDRDYADNGSHEVISRDDLKAFTRDKAIEVRNRCALNILKICREIGEYNGVDFEHYAPGELE